MSSMEEGVNDIERIAIVGISGRFPGAEDLDQFWENLRAGVEAISSFTDDELIASGVDPELLKSPNYVRARGVLPHPEWFDASFFGFSPRDAEIIDPQLRAYLENCWETLENAGYDPEVYKGLIGVFGGMSAGQYVLYNLLPNRELVASVGAVQLRLFNDKDFLTPLVAYRLNLKGPTVTVQTACSTSLVAVHLACQSLLSYQCDLALAGGVSVNVPPKSGYVPVEGVFAPDGHCRAFDAEAQGTVSGAGVGSVLLKRLSEAIADGDTIHAVVRGSAINNDGALRVSYSAPSVEGQSEVIAMAQAVAGVTPDSITYVEAHGTATPLGDPIEVAALSRVFRAETEKKGFCGIGSVKSNIGHADAAAGIASLIKTVLALKHRQLPPTLNFSQPNSEIDFANSPFYVNQHLHEWGGEGELLRAGVSSFAMGGTNAHVIVEEAPAPAPASSSRPLQLILLSAKTESALDSATDRLAIHLRQHPELDPADVAYTLQVGRRGFRHRRAIVGENAEDVSAALEQKDPRRLFNGEASSGQANIAFMFSGLGNHYVGMGRELYESEPFFREQVDYCCELLKSHLGADLRDIMFARSGDRPDDAKTAITGGRGIDLRQMLRGEEREDEASQRLNQTIFSQPALFVIEYALARLWMKWGIVPKAMIGYSIGEYTAACLAAVFSLEDALKLVAQRAQLIQKLKSGSMLAVPLPVSEVQPLLGGLLDLAAVNGPSVCVVSGATGAVDELNRTLTTRGVAVRRLQTTHAFHSRMITPIVDPFTSLLKNIKLNPPAVPLISNVTGDWLSAAQATDPNYWATHLCRPVLFGDGIERLWKGRNSVLLEVGPGQALGAWALQHPESQRVEGRVVLSSLRHSYDQQSDLAFLLNTLGRLWLAGVEVDWTEFHEGFQRRRVPLPTYPFERQRYWVEQRKQPTTASAAKPSLAKRPDIGDWFYLPAWKQTAPRATFALEEPAEPALRYLIFLDECGVGQSLAKLLEAAGQQIVTIKAGGSFRKLGEQSFAIAPDQAGDYDALFGELRTRKLLPQIICHLWGLTCGTDDETPEAHLTNGFFSLLFLAQALGNRNTSDQLRLIAVGNGVQAVTGQELLCPAKAAALGVCRVIPQEYANVVCQYIDITPSGDSEGDVDALSEQLLNELAAQSADTLVAYRGQHRWVQEYDAIRLEGAGRKSRLREGGVYLITGGLGGIGLTIADHLARTLRARLVLIGRSALPEPVAWDNWLAEHSEDDPVSQKIKRLKSFEAYGAEVLALSADVTSRIQMESVVAAARARFGAIDGVLHAAGVPPGGMIQMKTTETASAVLAPKIQGTLVLDAVMRDEKPDFIALCSSLNGVFGGFGLVDHCAANAFLDAFAEARVTRRGTHVFSINWDGWLEVGQAANAALSAGLQEMLSASRQVKESKHPLLEEVLVDEPEKQIYSTRMTDSSHWPVSEHRLMGRSVLPGTGYLEMVRAAFAERAAGQTVVFRKVLFMSPLVIQHGEVREVRVTLTKNEDAYDFSVTSTPASSNGPAWQEHARGQVSAVAPESTTQYPLIDTLARIGPQDVSSLERTRQIQNDTDPQNEPQAAQFKEDDRNYGPRWQNLLKRVGLKDGEAVAELELPEEFVDDLKDYALHPSLMDASVGFAQIAGEGFYLPMAYKSIKVYAPLTSKLFSYAKYPNGNAMTSDILTCDLLLMDEHGNPLVEIEEYTLRRITTAAAVENASKAIDGAGLEMQPPRAQQEAVADPAGGKPTALITEGILPEEGAAVFDRLLGSGLRVSRFVVATRDLHEMIRESRERTGQNLLDQINKLQTRQSKHPRPNLPVAYVAPRSETESRLAELWQEVVAVNEVGVHDNFFDLGGDSLLATLLIGRIGDTFGIDLSLRTIFEAPTPAEMAVSIVQQQALQVDEQALSDILGSIKNLSAEEIQGILDANQAAP